jgi:hypothetical protein
MPAIHTVLGLLNSNTLTALLANDSCSAAAIPLRNAAVSRSPALGNDSAMHTWTKLTSIERRHCRQRWPGQQLPRCWCRSCHPGPSAGGRCRRRCSTRLKARAIRCTFTASPIASLRTPSPSAWFCSTAMMNAFNCELMRFVEHLIFTSRVCANVAASRPQREENRALTISATAARL